MRSTPASRRHRTTPPRATKLNEAPYNRETDTEIQSHPDTHVFDRAGRVVLHRQQPAAEECPRRDSGKRPHHDGIRALGPRLYRVADKTAPRHADALSVPAADGAVLFSHR